MSETARQKFLRNHQENIGIMRAALVRAERDGSPTAGIIREIIEAWEGIGASAQAQEDEGKGAT